MNVLIHRFKEARLNQNRLQKYSSILENACLSGAAAAGIFGTVEVLAYEPTGHNFLNNAVAFSALGVSEKLSSFALTANVIVKEMYRQRSES